MTEWLDNPVVGSAIYEMALNHEVKWEIHGKTEFGIRHTRINWSKDTLRWLEILDFKKRPISIFIGTNIINWNAVDSLPPRLRENKNLNKSGRDDYNKIWQQYLTPATCEARKLEFHNIWLGKSMVWDIDHEDNLKLAFQDALSIYEYLKKLDYHPAMVFSGSKGFHIWLNYIEAEKLVGHSFKTVQQDDPLRNLGKLYREKIQEVSVSSTGRRLPNLDLAPAQRQGIIRCPYSQHSKTGLVVWPLSEDEINNLRKNDFITAVEVAALIHSWETTNFAGEKIPMPAHYKTINRGFALLK